MTRKLEFTLKNISFYFLGVFILGFGAVSGKASDLGAGAWDAVPINLADAFKTEFGYASWLIALLLMIFIIIMTKDIVKAAMLLPAAFVSLSILFWENIVFNDYISDTLTTGIPLFVCALVFIPLGLSFIIASNFPAFVFDELTIVMSKFSKKDSFGNTRILIEMLGASIAIVIALLSDNVEGFGTVGFGTIILAFTIGPSISYFIKLLGVKKDEKTSNGI